MAAASHAKPPSRAWLIVPVFFAGLLLVGLGLKMRCADRTVTVAEVIEQVQTVAMRRSGDDASMDGGFIGPWWLTASAVGPESGQFQNLRISSGSLEVAARQARLIVDPESDTFSFDLTEAVLTRIPETEQEGSAESTLLTLETYRLGPAPFGRDIVP